jgi:RND family efflux transporter MFP subunit
MTSIAASPRLLAVATVVALATLAGCAKEAPKAEVVRPVLSTVVTPTALNGAAAAYAGEVRARHENDLAFRIGGKAVARLVEVSSTVRKGQVLARLDPMDVQLQAESARAQLASAEADLTWARAELERYRSLREKNFVSAAVLDQKQQAFDAAQARTQQLRAQLAVSQNQSGYANLVAETEGVVTAVNLEPGQVVTAGQAVMRIARPSEKEVQVSVPESRIDELRKASALAVVLWSDPTKRYAARLREFAPNADATTRTFTAKVTILQADDAVKLGMTANLLLAGDSTATRIVVPLTAIGDQEGKPVVWVVDTQSLQVNPRRVELGAYREDGAVLTSGLQGGERIVIAGVQKLLPGQKVRLANESELQSFVGAAANTRGQVIAPEAVATSPASARQTSLRAPVRN